MGFRETVVIAVLAGLAPAPSRAAEPDPRVEFSVDPRFELLGVIQLLDDSRAAPWWFRSRELEYVRAARAHFGRFKGHPAVRLNARIDPQDMSLGFATRLAVLAGCSPPPALEPRAGTQLDAAVGEWLESLRTFWRETRFQRFLSKNGRLLEPQVQLLREALEPLDYVRKFEAYTGMPFRGRVRVFWSPFYMPAAGTRVMREPDGSHELTGIFPIDEASEALETSKLWHELAHAALDPLAEESPQLAAKAPLLKTIPWGCHRNWTSCAQEQVNDAVWTRLLALEEGEAAGGERARRLRDNWFGSYPHVDALAARLKEYERSRARYKTLADFYPRLVNAFPKP